MKTVIAFLFLTLLGCTQRNEPEPSFTVIGNWEGYEWSSNGTPVPVIKFSIQTDNGNLVCSPGMWIKEKCQFNCVEDIWEVTSIKYFNGDLVIKWKRGFTFNGTRKGKILVGDLSYLAPSGEYVWKHNAELIKNE